MQRNTKSVNEAQPLMSEAIRNTGEESTMIFQVEGDYAQGLRTLPVELEGSDYARGLRTLPHRPEGADYARGLRTLPYEPEGPDYARGLRSTTDGAGSVRNERKGLTTAGAPAGGK